MPTDNPPQTASAVQQVLNTVELLELILLNLTMRDIFTSERVSHHWRRVISSSHPIQKKQYALADPSLEHSPRPNPAYLQRFVQQAALYALSQVNPRVTFHDTAPVVRDGIEAFAQEQASWRRMMLFQPPCVKAYLHPLSLNRSPRERWRIANPDGLRMADVVDFFDIITKQGGPEAVELLAETVIGKVVWSVNPELPADGSNTAPIGS